MSLEKNLIAGCLKDPEVVKKAKRAKLNPALLEGKVFRYLYKAALEIHDTGDEPTPKVMKEYIQHDRAKDSDDKQALTEMVDSLAKRKATGAKFSIAKLSDIRAEKLALKMLSSSTDMLLKGDDIGEVLPHLKNRLKELETDSNEYELFDYWEDWETRKVERKEIEEGDGRSIEMCLNLEPFKTPYFPRGLQVETITSVAGGTYAGKSVMLSNFIRVAAHPKNGLNVLYIFAENRKIEAASRLDAIFLGRDYDSLYEENKDADKRADEFFTHGQKEGWGRVVLSSVTPKKFTANTIRAMLEELREKGIEIDAVAIDSPDHQVPIESTGEFWQDKGQVYWDLKDLIKEQGLILLTTLPMKASSIDKATVKSEDMAGSYDISRIVDNIVAFNTDPEDRLLNRGKLQVPKARDGETDFKILYFYFENTHRLIPWHRVFNGEIDPTAEDDDTIYRINQFKEKYESDDESDDYEQIGGPGGLNVRKRKNGQNVEEGEGA